VLLRLKERVRGDLKYNDYADDYGVNHCLVSEPSILIDEGIIMSDDTLITSGKILELVRQGKTLLDNGDLATFKEVMNVISEFNECDRSLIRGCIISTRGDCILDILCHND
jgi:hypothetical protein